MGEYVKDRPEGRKIYLPKVSVLAAARRRIQWAFDEFANVVVSVSGGKDSTCLFDLAWHEANLRGRPLHAFFLDQEAEYESSIAIVRQLLSRPGVIPWWYQVPMRMTNATSYEEEMLCAWEPGTEWMREKEPGSVHEAPGAPDRFYPFINWFHRQWQGPTCVLVGLRTEESPHRFAAATKHPARDGLTWTSRAVGPCVNAYPLYDWAFEDVWTYLGKFKVPYNRAYDWLWVKGKHIPSQRVSNLIHEKAFHCLTTLQEFEPDTYDRLVRRLKGVHTAALYAGEASVFSAKKLPPQFTTWREYRDFLLSTHTGEHRAGFEDRFAGQPETESVYRQQVRQLLINDWENNVPVRADGSRIEEIKKKWMEIL